MSPYRPVTLNSKEDDAAKPKITRANLFISSACGDESWCTEGDGIEVSLVLVDTDAAGIP
jgi:hypothetical protein